jgi:RNA polymerase sigma factor (sigma-70 family)
MRPTDEEILQLFKQPESREKAFRLLMSTYQERLYYHVRRYVHTHDDAHDILQNTFIKIWNNLSQFRGEAGLYTWLYRIAGNEAISYIRKLKKQPATFTETGLEFSGSVTDAPSSQLITQKLEMAIASLPDKQKQVFIMRYYDEMPYEQMAIITETSVGALKASYHHAVKKIEEMLSA